MRILQLSKFYPPDPGGLESVVAAIAEGAAAAGHDVRVVCATGSGWMRPRGRRATEPPRLGVTVVRLPTLGVLWSQPLAPGYLAAARWPADVVHLHHPHPLADVATLFGARAPLIVTHHSDVRRQAIARGLYGPLVRAVLRRARAIVVATQAHVTVSGELRGFEHKARIIPFGVDERRFTAEPVRQRPPGFPDGAGGPIGLFVGRLVGYKGLDVLLDAIVGSDLHVVIVGDGPLRQHLAERIVRDRLGDRVVLVGAVSDEMLPNYHRAADYFVLPSRTTAEMFGIALAESMACGKPVISTTLPTGVREVNVGGTTGLEVPPDDAPALRAAMQQLSRDSGLRARFGAAARARVVERFTLKGMVEKHLELYREMGTLTP